MDNNQIKFEVKGIGEFIALKEVTAPMFFLDRRKMMADMFGGIVELVRMETLIRLGTRSEDQVQKELASSLLDEMSRADWFIRLKTEMIEYPKGFNIAKLKPEGLNDVIFEFQKARGLFREEPTPGASEGPPATPVAQQEKA